LNKLNAHSKSLEITIKYTSTDKNSAEEFLKKQTNICQVLTFKAPCVLYIRTGVSLLSRERFLYM